MEMKTFFTWLLLNVFLLLTAHCSHSYASKTDPDILTVFPTRLQFFEYESISFSCDGLNHQAKWRGVRNIEDFIPTCTNYTVTPTVNCTINNAFETDTGKYWCEDEDGWKSNALSITVTIGSVILESPAVPVIEGKTINLYCRKKAAPLNQTADFYKNDLKIGTSYFGKMTIHNVSKSDEGLYKCTILEAGESPESWLIVINKTLEEQNQEDITVTLESPAHPVMEGETVVLSCLNETSASLPAVFYKDGLFIGTSSVGNMTIHQVYKSHEGLYKCTISGVGESSEKWLFVRGIPREACFCSDQFFHLLLLLRVVLTIVMVALLILLVGLLHCGKLGPKKNS
ncbi:unnamed protein product [Oreochromis niloticus]|nr:unnamed protein product [Mustela putorius furo]